MLVMDVAGCFVRQAQRIRHMILHDVCDTNIVTVNEGCIASPAGRRRYIIHVTRVCPTGEGDRWVRRCMGAVVGCALRVCDASDATIRMLTSRDELQHEREALELVAKDDNGDVEEDTDSDETMSDAAAAAAPPIAEAAPGDAGGAAPGDAAPGGAQDINAAPGDAADVNDAYGDAEDDEDDEDEEDSNDAAASDTRPGDEPGVQDEDDGDADAPGPPDAPGNEADAPDAPDAPGAPGDEAGGAGAISDVIYIDC
jgi:hypothetical protein